MDNESFDQWEEERRERQKQRERRRSERRRERGAEQGAGEAEAGPAGRRPREGRKERVIHTRVSESLDDSIRRAADELRVPVSNLVRNVLEDVFEVVEKVTDNMGDIVGEVLEEVDDVRKRIQRDVRRGQRHARPHRRGRRTRHGHDAADEDFAPEDETEIDAEVTQEPAAEIEREEFPDVVGWQPLILNAPQQCTDCGRDLLKGDKAFCGMTSAGLSPRTLCPDCARARS